jgi:outer membrane beta-barrel protein
MSKKTFLLFLSISLFFISKPIIAGESSVYGFSWLDPDKEVYVLQNRKYRKAGRFHVNVGYGITTSGAFVDSNTIQARVGYFLTEDWGFEGFYAKNSGDENETAASVRNSGTSGAGSKPFRRIVDDYMGGFLVWSPFYAKVNTFNKIVYVDWLVGIGYGTLKETNNRQEFENVFNPVEKQESHSAIAWETALKFYISEMFNIRLDLTTLHYQAKTAKTGATDESWYTNYDLSLSLGLNF